MVRALVFDLDDTLYVEKDFVMSGYRAVANHLADTGRCPFEGTFPMMVETYETRGRHLVFPVLLERFPDASLSMAELIDVYRQHQPAIQLYPGYMELLRRLGRHYRLGIITDGLPAVQERKIRALGLNGVMDKVIYTWEYGSEKQKPHPLSFSLMLEYLRAEPASALFIGDNPDKDCRGAHAVGMKFAHVQHAVSHEDQFDAANQENPEFVIETLFELPQILQRLN
jgi:putative hydrolase of the HAD superfamily